MNTKLIGLACAVVFACLGVVWLIKAQPTQTAVARFECAMIKWDGPDKLAIIYPDRAAAVHFQLAVRLGASP
jgi:hypothetical protein